MPSTTARKLSAAIAVTALSGGALALAAAPAGATPRTPVPYYNCTYPYVCLYNQTMDIVLKYQDVTTSWQSFSRTDVSYGLNTRHDDVAYIHYTNGDWTCMPSGDPMAVYDLSQFGTPNGIRIDSSSVCADGVRKMTAAKRSN